MQNENRPPLSASWQPGPVFGGEKQPWWKTILQKIWPAGASTLHKGFVIGTAVACVLIVGLVTFAALRTHTPVSIQTAEQDQDENPDNSSNATSSGDVPSSNQDKPEEKKDEAKPPARSGNDSKAPSGGSAPNSSTGGGSNTGGGGGSSGSGCALPAYPNETCTGVKAGITLQ